MIYDEHNFKKGDLVSCLSMTGVVLKTTKTSITIKFFNKYLTKPHVIYSHSPDWDYIKITNKMNK